MAQLALRHLVEKMGQNRMERPGQLGRHPSQLQSPGSRCPDLCNASSQVMGILKLPVKRVVLPFWRLHTPLNAFVQLASWRDLNRFNKDTNLDGDSCEADKAKLAGGTCGFNCC